MDGDVKIGIVIPTTGKASLLDVLASLTRQTHRPDRIIVSYDDADPHGRHWCHWDNIHEVWPHRPRQSAAATRNSGFRRCLDLDRILVVDDDCLCPPDLVEAHVKAHAVDPKRTLFGLRQHVNAAAADAWQFGGVPLEELPETKPELRMRDDPRRVLQRFALQSGNRDVNLHRFFYTCHASFPAWAVERTGGMWEEMKGSGYEDVEFGLRLHRAGSHLLFLPSPCVYHVDHPTCPLQGEHAPTNKMLYALTVTSETVSRNGGIWRLGHDSHDRPRPRLRRR
jgi:glycosyltransferase involved in cell wall biosynthesis